MDTVENMYQVRQRLIRRILLECWIRNNGKGKKKCYRGTHRGFITRIKSRGKKSESMRVQRRIRIRTYNESVKIKRLFKAEVAIGLWICQEQVPKRRTITHL
jgi:hypothetical protein